MNEILTVLATWLALGQGLPPMSTPPAVEFVTTNAMAERRVATATRAAGATSSPVDEVHREQLVAFYDDGSRTVFLPADWTPTSAADVSVLVHELVHHVQNDAGSSYSCAAEREREAYAAQAAWLGLMGSSLEEAFELDPMTLLLRTRCLQ